MKIADLFEAFDRNKIHDLTNPQEPEVGKVGSYEQLAKIIKKNCGIMLKAYQKSGKVLYRGMKTGEAVQNSKIDIPAMSVIATGIRKDRRPVEMDNDVHELLHDAFMSVGLTVTRKNAIFTSANKAVASDWGKTFVVFVKDGWQGLYFENAKTTYSFYDLRNVGDHVYMNVSQIKRGNWDDSEKKDMIKTEMETLQDSVSNLGPVEFKDVKNLSYVLENNFYEVLIAGDSYIAVSVPVFKEHLAPLLGIKL